MSTKDHDGSEIKHTDLCGSHLRVQNGLRAGGREGLQEHENRLCLEVDESQFLRYIIYMPGDSKWGINQLVCHEGQHRGRQEEWPNGGSTCWAHKRFTRELNALTVSLVDLEDTQVHFFDCRHSPTGLPDGPGRTRRARPRRSSGGFTPPFPTGLPRIPPPSSW
jgi:hypothetical protein